MRRRSGSNTELDALRKKHDTIRKLADPAHLTAEEVAARQRQ